MALLNLSIYVVFVDSHQGINDVMPFSTTTKAYVELIGVEKTKTEYTCNSYIVKSNNESKES
jgi:hypothetical protein